MQRICVARERGVVVATKTNSAWHADEVLTNLHPQCLAADPLHPERLYCGTFGEGVWRSDDAGTNWRPISEGIDRPQMMAVAVSPTERAGAECVVYAGTEPSALYRSENGGATWRECASLRVLPSAPTWSFPPRPHTSHVRAITPDPIAAGHLYVAIEAGALVRSMDGGETWLDRTADGPWDTHTLLAHAHAPNKLYSAAGDGFMRPGRGYAESDDAGETWRRFGDGLAQHYLWGAAVHPDDPGTVIVSAATSPNQAHNPMNAESHVYRRTAGGPWREVEGLPPPTGTLAAALAADAAASGTFYAAMNTGLFVSADAGAYWEPIPIPWPDRLQHTGAITVVTA